MVFKSWALMFGICRRGKGKGGGRFSAICSGLSAGRRTGEAEL